MLKRIIWKNKKGRVVGLDLVECGADYFDIVNSIRNRFEGKGLKGVFMISNISPSKKSWLYGCYSECTYFYNKVVLQYECRYEFVYCFNDGKLYKVK